VRYNGVLLHQVQQVTNPFFEHEQNHSGGNETQENDADKNRILQHHHTYTHHLIDSFQVN